MDDRGLSMREIREYLGVSHDTVSRWSAEGAGSQQNSAGDQVRQMLEI